MVLNSLHVVQLAWHQTEARFPFKRNRLRCVNENRKKRKRLCWQPWLAACQRKRIRFLRFSFTHATQAIAFEWKPGLSQNFRNVPSRTDADRSSCSEVSRDQTATGEVRCRRAVWYAVPFDVDEQKFDVRSRCLTYTATSLCGHDDVFSLHITASLVFTSSTNKPSPYSTEE